jgi:hypothetical protein
MVIAEMTALATNITGCRQQYLQEDDMWPFSNIILKFFMDRQGARFEDKACETGAIVRMTRTRHVRLAPSSG